MKTISLILKSIGIFFLLPFFIPFGWIAFGREAKEYAWKHPNRVGFLKRKRK